jgi:selenium metabolism protein YedF
MPNTSLDCRGMPCPQPLMAAKKLVESQSPAALSVLVDEEAAMENVSRFLTACGYAVVVDQQAGAWSVNATRDPQAAPAPAPDVADFPCPVPAEGRQRILVLLTTETLGQGHETLGEKLMGNFLKTLPEMGEDLWRIVMLNGGVKLAAQGSAHLEALKALEAGGVDILVCGTCLEFFSLLDKKAVGQTTNMLDVVTSLQLASKVIRP